MPIYSKILRRHFEKLDFDMSLMDDFAKNFEAKASDTMQNLDAMCIKLADIRASGERMVIYTDFDVDGIMSSVVAYAGFSELGFNVSLFKPTPALGYGMRTTDIDDIIAIYPDVKVIFTGDVGIVCNEAILHAKEKGLTVLVTDHHLSGGPCAADIAVNPNQFGETYSHSGICGSYVIYKILEEYAKRYCSPSTQADIYRLQVFAGIATISDVMPLVYENRPLVRNSVAIARYFFGYELGKTDITSVHSENYCRAFIGLKKLLEYFKTKGKIKTSDDIDEQFYGFYLVPFLNSCKRMDGDMRGVYDIFFSEYISPLPGYDNMSCVETGIRYIEVLSDRRKEITEETFNKLLREKEEGVTDNSQYMKCEVYIADIGAGICGLLASKFMSYSGMPTLVIVKNADGSYTGSGRNPGWMDFTGSLMDYDPSICCAGHREAFGISIPNEDALKGYIGFYSDVVLKAYDDAVASDKIIKDTDIVVAYTDAVAYDFIIDPIDIREFLDEARLYHPFGNSFPEPCFKLAIPLGTYEEKLFGSVRQHTKLVTSDGIEILLFNLAADYEKLKYENRGTNCVLICRGTFRYDTFDNIDYDNICFFCNDIEIVRT